MATSRCLSAFAVYYTKREHKLFSEIPRSQSGSLEVHCYAIKACVFLIKWSLTTLLLALNGLGVTESECNGDDGYPNETYYKLFSVGH